jgi:formamidopyrimidine-DNA glycosylase
MPELPEVETVVRGLREYILNRTITSVVVTAPPYAIITSASFGKTPFGDGLSGNSIQSISRRGKNILISLSGNLILWVHLKMTGRFLWVDKNRPAEKHDLVRYSFANCDHDLIFNDYRRFGRHRLFTSDEIREQAGIKDLGPEPLEISRDDFVRLCRESKRMIKPALLDQTFLAGVGNIYADEALFASRIHPKKSTHLLTKEATMSLHKNIQRILRMAIDRMGSSVDSYRGINGESGTNQKYLKVYGREGLPCKRCRTKIKRVVIGSRSTHFCPLCQRAPRRLT